MRCEETSINPFSEVVEMDKIKITSEQIIQMVEDSIIAVPCRINEISPSQELRENPVWIWRQFISELQTRGELYMRPQLKKQNRNLWTGELMIPDKQSHEKKL